MTIRCWIGLSISVVCSWVAVLMTTMLLSDDAPSALVLFPNETLISALPEGTAIVEWTRYTVLLKNETPGFTRRLYQAGARAVLPGGLSGCFRPV